MVLTDIFQVLLIITTFGGIFLYSIYRDPSSIANLFSAQQYFQTPIHISNVMMIDSKSNKPIRIGYKKLETGKKVRVSKKTNEPI